MLSIIFYLGVNAVLFRSFWETKIRSFCCQNLNGLLRNFDSFFLKKKKVWSITRTKVFCSEARPGFAILSWVRPFEEETKWISRHFFGHTHTHTHTLFLTHWFGKDPSSLPQYPHSPSSSVIKFHKAKDGIETRFPAMRSTWKYCVNWYSLLKDQCDYLCPFSLLRSGMSPRW